MTNLFPGLAAIALYSGGFVYHLLQLRSNIQLNPSRLQQIAALALGAHLIAVINFLLQPQGLDLSLVKIFALLAFAINLIVFFSGLTKTQHSLYLLLFPISSITILMAFTFPSSKPVMVLTHTMQVHVLLSIMAYSLLSIAALQALFTGLLDRQLKNKRQHKLIKTFPPLETMESVLFNIIWIGQLFLTLSLLTGFFFYDDFFEKQLLHKVIMSMLAWIFFSLLLYGRYYWGWRGHIATRLTWAGFLSVLIGYIGTKFVIEFVLTQPLTVPH